jgi:hypothetical protein
MERFGFGSLVRFTEELRLRFLLRPLSYDADITALRQRSSGDVFQFDGLCEHIAPSPETTAAALTRTACSEQYYKGQADEPLREGTRVRVSNHGEGVYERFSRSMIGANNHYICFNSGCTKKVVLKKLTPQDWGVLAPSEEQAAELAEHAAIEAATKAAACKLSPWRARSVAATWLERQGEAGRSKLLVPELLELEERLQAWTREGVDDWLRCLWQLVQHLRWGVGTFWAPHYNTSPEVARGMFAANIPVTSPLHLSDAAARLGPHQMCLPLRIGISPTIHQLLGHSGWVNSVNFSRDGQKIVSASSDESVRVWSAVTGECEQTLAGHSHWVNSAAFSHDGQKIVSASDDKSVRVWSAVTGECEQTLVGHRDRVKSAHFSPDGLKIVSASDKDGVRVWSVVTGEWI